MDGTLVRVGKVLAHVLAVADAPALDAALLRAVYPQLVVPSFSLERLAAYAADDGFAVRRMVVLSGAGTGLVGLFPTRVRTVSYGAAGCHERLPALLALNAVPLGSLFGGPVPACSAIDLDARPAWYEDTAAQTACHF